MFRPEEDEEQLAQIAASLGPLSVTNEKRAEVPTVDEVVGPQYDQAPPEPEALPVAPAYDQTPPEPEAAPVAPAPAPAPAPEPAEPVDTTPSWYKDEAPPPAALSGLAGLLGNLAGGGLSALATHASNKYQNEGKKAHRRKENPLAVFLKDGAAPGVSGYIGGLGDDYKNRLDAATKQAEMKKLARGANGSDGLGAQRLKLSQDRFNAQRSDAEEKARIAAELDDLNSEATKKIQQAAVLNKTLDQGTASQMTGNQILKYRPQAGAAARQDQGFNNALNMQGIRETAQINQENRAEDRQLSKEEREEGRTLGKEEREQIKANEIADIPGWRQVSKRAPSPVGVERARVIADASDRAIFAANELSSLQEKLNALRVSGKLYTWLADDPEGQQAFADAKLMQKTLMDAQRELSNLGVLQQFEKEMVEEVNPDAGSLDEYFRGKFAYNSYARLMPKYAAVRMKSYGYAPDDGSEPAPIKPARTPDVMQDLKAGGAQTRAAVKKGVGAVKQVAENTAGNVKEAVNESGAGPAVNAAVSDLKAAANAAAATPIAGWFKITKSDGSSSERQLTEGQVELLGKKYKLNRIAK